LLQKSHLCFQVSQLREQVGFRLGRELLGEKRETGFCWLVKRTMMQRRQVLDLLEGHTLDPSIAGMRMHGEVGLLQPMT
jgi:hypothetical protein